MDNNSLSVVVENDFCIGCGACAVGDNSVQMKMNKYGMYQPVFSEQTKQKEQLDVCPFATEVNETILGEKYFSAFDGIQYQKQVGYYQNLYAGYVEEKDFREKGSSGGMTSWVLATLLEKGEIDAVIHVGKGHGNALFSYVISESVEDVRMRTKSQYYPTHFDGTIEQLDHSKKYAFVGIPCYIKGVRLLAEQRPELKASIRFFVGIFCGHLKSAAFAESLALQEGIFPNDFKTIDFRVKEGTPSANLYKIRVEGFSGIVSIKENRELYGTDWGLGFFKPKACDWCDDITGELADVVCGDAWLPQYSSDYRGTNVVIVRNPLIDSILRESQQKKLIKLDELSLDDLIKSQAANFRHRHEGLSVRVKHAEKQKKWIPIKRIKADSFDVSKERQNIYLLREDMARLSHIYFYEAKERQSFWWFKFKMAKIEYKYYLANGVFWRKVFREIVYSLKLNRLKKKV